MKIKVSEASGAALDWLVAKALGYTMREPLRGTNERARRLTVPFTMFEVNYQQTAEGINEDCWVSPITVTRFGVNTMLGATAESIDFTDSRGREASGSVDLFYFDKAEAELEVNGAMVGYAEGFEPSTNWAQGGPLIARMFEGGLQLTKVAGQVRASLDTPNGFYYGPTPLIAAMRCYVASKLGDTVEVPGELQ